MLNKLLSSFLSVSTLMKTHQQNKRQTSANKNYLKRYFEIVCRLKRTKVEKVRDFKSGDCFSILKRNSNMRHINFTIKFRTKLIFLCLFLPSVLKQDVCLIFLYLEFVSSFYELFEQSVSILFDAVKMLNWRLFTTCL